MDKEKVLKKYRFNTFIIRLQWLLVIFGLIYMCLTNHLLLGIFCLSIPPLRYFFFPLIKEKEYLYSSVDRILPITAFMHFLNKSLPMPFGDQVMNVVGIIVGCLLSIYNGYALLIYETITIKKDYPPKYSSRDKYITDIIRKYHLLHRQAEILVDWDDQNQQQKINKTAKFFKQKELAEQLNPLGVDFKNGEKK